MRGGCVCASYRFEKRLKVAFIMCALRLSDASFFLSASNFLSFSRVWVHVEQYICADRMRVQCMCVCGCLRACACAIACTCAIACAIACTIASASACASACACACACACLCVHTFLTSFRSGMQWGE